MRPHDDAPPPRPGMFSPWERALHHGATILVGLSGAIYAWMKYLLEAPADDPFTILNHPWQPTMLHVHVLMAPIWLLALGLMIRDHVIGRLRDPNRRRGRRTGLAAVLLLGPMILSGYLLQTVTAPGWRGGLVVVHLAAGFAYLLTYAVHVVMGRLAVRQRREIQAAGGHPLEAGGMHLQVGLRRRGRGGKVPAIS